MLLILTLSIFGACGLDLAGVALPILAADRFWRDTTPQQVGRPNVQDPQQRRLTEMFFRVEEQDEEAESELDLGPAKQVDELPTDQPATSALPKGIHNSPALQEPPSQ